MESTLSFALPKVHVKNCPWMLPEPCFVTICDNSTLACDTFGQVLPATGIRVQAFKFKENEMKTQILFASCALATLLAVPAQAKDEVVVKRCEITITNGEISKKGDCEGNESIEILGDGSHRVQILGGPGGFPGETSSVFVGRGSALPGGAHSFVFSGGPMMPGMFGPGHGELDPTWDTDKDGEVSQEEVLAAKRAEMAKYDGNRNGTLNLAEFEDLWMAEQRKYMVDQFQALDEDGNGKVTRDEFLAPAKRQALHRAQMMQLIHVEVDDQDAE
jgi:Ca2+-binding EF-hand superfamily protein